MCSPSWAVMFRAAAALCLLFADSALAAPALIPLPQTVIQTNSGFLTLCPPQVIPGAPTPSPTSILVDGAGRETAEFLATTLFKSTGYRFQIGTNSGQFAVPQAILLTTNSALTNLGTEGYELTIATNSVVIRAPSSAGLFYGVQTLFQLFPPQIYAATPVTGVPWTAPCIYIQDWPRFSWRGWMLDSARHFFNKDEVKQFLDTMAMHKLNMFHWHLDDDSGWRIEIKKWPLLTQIGAWRTNLMFNLNPRATTAWDDTGTNYGGFYFQSDIREIVQYAAQRHITIVPEIEMPGHTSASLAAYPQFACGCPTCLNGPYSLNVTSYSGGVFCLARPETISFLHDILGEVMDLFPGPYIHTGGDEVDPSFRNWNRHSLDQALTNSLGISTWQQYQSIFDQDLANWIKSQGHTMIGWSEIMNGQTVTNTALMDWQNGASSRAFQAATNRINVVMCPSAICYINKFVNTANQWSNEPPSQAGNVPLDSVYNFEPVPAGLDPAYTNYIIGAQGNSWTEWIPSVLNMEFKMFPRLSALAEVNWTSASLKNYTDFTNRLVIHNQRLSNAGVNFNPFATPPTIGTWSSAQTPATYFTLSWNITWNVTKAGEIDVSFCWKTGANGLDIAWVALLENGVEIDRDTHPGFTGVTPNMPTYILHLPALRPGATYTLAASVEGRGGTNSNGIVYRTNWN